MGSSSVLGVSGFVSSVNVSIRSCQQCPLQQMTPSREGVHHRIVAVRCCLVTRTDDSVLLCAYRWMTRSRACMGLSATRPRKHTIRSNEDRRACLSCPTSPSWRRSSSVGSPDGPSPTPILVRATPEELTALAGTTLGAATRRGKFLLLPFERDGAPFRILAAN